MARSIFSQIAAAELREKTASSLGQTAGGAIMGALAGAISGSRRSLDDKTLQGMQQGALVGMLAGVAAAQGTSSKALQFGAGALGGAVGSRGPRGPSRPQLHLRMDRHITGEQESNMNQHKVAELRARFFAKEALSTDVIARAAKARGVSAGYLRQMAKARVENASIARSGVHGKTTAMRNRHNASDGGVGERYLASWKRNKPHTKVALSTDVVARAAAKRGVSPERLRGIAQLRAGKANRKFISSPMHRNTAQLMGSMHKSPTTDAAKSRAAEASNYLNSWSRSRTKTAEGHLGHAAELAGLGILAAPSIQHFRGKPMSDRKSHAVNAVGLGVLAAPSLLALARRKKGIKHAAHNPDVDARTMSGRGAAYGAGIGAMSAALGGKGMVGIAGGTLNGALLGYMTGSVAGSVFGAGRRHQERLMAKKAMDAQGNELFSQRPTTKRTIKTDADHVGEAVLHPLAAARRRRFNTLNASKE